MAHFWPCRIAAILRRRDTRQATPPLRQALRATSTKGPTDARHQ